MYRVGKTMDDGVQRGKVQGTTCRKNKQNEGVRNGRKDSGKSTRGERLGSVHKAMNGSRQVTEAVKKANRALAQLRRTISNKEIDTVIPIYKATVRPHLEYCIQAWAPYLKKDINALEQVQHRATKMITSLRKLPYEQRLKECNLTTLEERRKRGDLLETHKIMHGLERIPEVTFFARGDTLRRGHTLKIYKERSKREPRRNFFSQRVVIPWNALPEKVVCSKSTLQFKIEYDKFWGV